MLMTVYESELMEGLKFTVFYFDKKIIRRLGPTNLGPSKIWAVENLGRLFDCSILSI